MKVIDITGQKFGRLTIIGRDILTNKKDTYWLCKCDCTKDKYISVAGYNLKNGHTQSCGCLQKEKAKQKKYNTYDLSREYGVGWTTSGEEFYFDLEDYDKIKEQLIEEIKKLKYENGKYKINHKFVYGLFSSRGTR